MVDRFAAAGFCRFAAEPAVLDWVRHALGPARAALRDPDFAGFHQCGGTWFVGLEALPNDGEGRVGGSGPLAGAAVEFTRSAHGGWPELHRGQVSVVWPGYPKPRAGEGESAFRYRLKRDAAHVDGILAEGPDRRRRVREPHWWILGIALTEADQGASPLVAWEGSHRVMRERLGAAIAACDPSGWGDIDVTEVYQTARREVFESCARVELPLKVGEAVLLHRLCLHGIAPWAKGARAAPEGRMIAYFRPEMPGGVAAWLG